LKFRSSKEKFVTSFQLFDARLAGMRENFDFAAEPQNAFASFEEATHYLEQVCARLELNHLAYSLVHSIDGTPDQVSWIATYDPAYMSYYMEHYSHLGDPSVETAFANNGIVDWAEWLSSDSMWRELFPMATRYGITKYGVSFPLNDGDFGNVLFSVNVKSSDEDWKLLRDSLVERFRPFAVYFHGRIKPLIQMRERAEINFAA
jgi:hypothetical protein